MNGRCGQYPTTAHEGGYPIKIGWARQIEGHLEVSARRLDGPGTATTETHEDAYPATGVRPTNIVFSDLGCWEVTGTLGEATTTAVLQLARPDGAESWHKAVALVALAAWKPRTTTGVDSPDLEPPARPDRPGQRQIRLTEDEIDDLVSAHLDGASSRELAARFGIHRTTVIAHLKRRGVPRRAPVSKLSTAQIRSAGAQYQAGDTLQVLANRYGVDTSTVRNHLVRTGVPMRHRGSASRQGAR